LRDPYAGEHGARLQRRGARAGSASRRARIGVLSTMPAAVPAIVRRRVPAAMAALVGMVVRIFVRMVVRMLVRMVLRMALRVVVRMFMRRFVRRFVRVAVAVAVFVCMVMRAVARIAAELVLPRAMGIAMPAIRSAAHVAGLMRMARMPVAAQVEAGGRGFGPDKYGYGLSAHDRHSTPWGYYRVKYSIQEIPMKIGELAKAAGTTVETVRYYEKEGLLPAPERGVNNYRSYGPVHAERLRLIRNCRALDMTQDEIRAILSLADSHGADCGPINEIFEDHMRHVDERIAELTQLKSQLSALRQRCASARPHAEDCGILHGLAELQVEQRPERHTHLG
jgi:Cd(II)/Pb(II)-responsive transcriptional regulator